MRVRKTGRRAVVLKTENKKCFNCGIIFECYIHEVRKFCSLKCYHLSMKNKPFPVERWVRCGKENMSWKGGRQKTKMGYICVPSPEHPLKDKHGCVFEHRLIMENYLGRTLNKKEVVHHINKNPQDNRIVNLMLFKNNSEHMRYHYANR